MHGVLSDDEFLIGSYDSHLDIGIRKGNHHILPRGHIGLIVEFHTEIAQVLADTAAHPAVVLSDSSRKDDEVHTVHHSGIRSDVLGHIIYKFLQSKFSLRVAGIGGIIQVTCIGRDAGQTEETALLVEHLAHCSGIESLLLLNICNDVRIHATAPGSHNHSLQGCESH